MAPKKGLNKFFDSKFSPNSWNTSLLGAPFNAFAPSSTNIGHLAGNHPANAPARATLNYFISRGILEWCKGDTSDIAVLRVAPGKYVAEWHSLALSDVRIVAQYDANNGALAMSTVDTTTGNVGQFVLNATSNPYDVSGLMLIIALAMEETVIAPCVGINQGELSRLKTAYAQGDYTAMQGDLYLVNDFIYYAISSSEINVRIRNENIMMLSTTSIQSEFASAELLCGQPVVIGRNATASSGSSYTMAQAKKMVEAYTNTLSWTADEEMLIPEFADDAEVPERVVTMAMRFIQTRDKAMPMVNPGWRGITGLGKSYGVKMLACILHTPLLWMTCASTTELEDFLSKHVPNTDPDNFTARSLPTFDDICNDPDYAYEQLTGKQKPGVSCEEVLTAYGKACAQQTNDKGNRNPFKIVESDFVKALVNGYIVEVQEFSRIRDSGTLVGLNNFCEPGSIIPLVDGRHVKRHPNAIVVWTDNVGYQSCRKVDGSVLSRVSYFFHDDELEESAIIRRICKNTSASEELVKKLLPVWKDIQQYCKDNDITDEGTCSVRELENFVMLSDMCAFTPLNIENACREAILSKLSSDPDIQEEIVDNCVKISLQSI